LIIKPFAALPLLLISAGDICRTDQRFHETQWPEALTREHRASAARVRPLWIGWAFAALTAGALIWIVTAYLAKDYALRTGIINQIRAFLLERGIAVRQGQRFLRATLPRILTVDCEVLSPRMARVIEALADDWRLTV
jgi:hypothetical protein